MADHVDYRFARRPRWVVGHLLVVGLALLFVSLGLWQLQRLDDRRETNAVVATRAALAPAAVESLVDPEATGDTLDDLRFRAVTATGSYRPGADLAVRASQGGRSGGRVFSVLELEGGAVVVLRGFVAPQDDGELVAPPPPGGEVEVEGLLIPRERLEGTFEQGVDDLVEGTDALPVVVQATTAEDGALVPVPPPDLGDGPHLGYAVQWFLFAGVGVVGYPLLLRRRAREPEADDG